ncbi:MAG: hypothetical protein ACJ8F3_09920 [Xanthobacteraceae bacterium]
MKQGKDAAITHQAVDPTGRDGAIDYIAKDSALHTGGGDATQPDAQFASLMGAAIIDLWSELPRDVQERLFEQAVALGQLAGHHAGVREDLAKFLHERHDRTHR